MVPSFLLTGGLSNGEWAIRLLGRHSENLSTLQEVVLRDSDPEALHRLRVSLRRLRTTVQQFSPALILPPAVRDPCLARSLRRLGKARDLDVLRKRLEHELIPGLPETEQRHLKPLLRRLRRTRRAAGERLQERLRSRSHRECITQLQEWIQQPRLTAFGSEPLQSWRHEWLLPSALQLAMHPGWWSQDPIKDAMTLHQLRRRIRQLRYEFENLRNLHDRKLAARIDQLSSLQDLLGQLHDLEVLARMLDQGSAKGPGEDLPTLRLTLNQHRDQLWSAWCNQSEPLRSRKARTSQRQALNRIAERRGFLKMCSAIPGPVSSGLVANLCDH